MFSKLIIIKLCQISNWNAIRTGVLISLSFPFPTVYRKAWYDLLIKKKFLQLAFLLLQYTLSSQHFRQTGCIPQRQLPPNSLAGTKNHLHV